MTRIVSIIALLLTTCTLHAAKMYQVDLVIFHQLVPNGKATNVSISGPMPALDKKAIVLTSGKTAKPYQLLPPAKSSLSDAFYHLNRKHQVIGHFSWLQPSAHPKTVAIPLTSKNGWQMQGTVDIKSGTFYSFKTNIEVSPPSAPSTYSKIAQNQRIKANTTYYFDHPQVGIIVSVHPV